MTPSQIQELRELADALQTQADWLAEYQHHWTACEQDAKFLLQIVANVRKAYPFLRACADREERAQAVADAVPTTWLNPLLTGSKAVIGKGPYTGTDIENLLRAVKDRVQSAALALQVDREKALRQLLKDWTDDVNDPTATQYEECARIVKQRCRDDLSRAIGDSNAESH